MKTINNRSLNADNGSYDLIIAPTHELTQQMEEEEEVVKFGTPLNITVVSIIDGLSCEEQGFTPRLACQIVIDKPTRLVDVSENHY
ncbi:unnamed protein product [Rotaria sp. Silwood1]|nr:unnamed protein product [Rotaria sp. Silwood1]